MEKCQPVVSRQHQNTVEQVDAKGSRDHDIRDLWHAVAADVIPIAEFEKFVSLVGWNIADQDRVIGQDLVHDGIHAFI